MGELHLKCEPLSGENAEKPQASHEGGTMSESGGYDDHPCIAEYYDHVVPYQNRSDISFYIDAAAESGSPVLELGCGTGRVMIPIARSGIEIVGIDSSSHMLEVCHKRLASESKEVQNRIELVQADMRSFSLNQTFTLITTPFRSFQHLLTANDQISCIETAYRHLKEGGRLILDVFNPWLEFLTRERLDEEFGEEPPFVMTDGREVIRKHRNTEIDRFNQIVYAELIYYVSYPDGREDRLVHSFPMRYLFRYEAQHLLERGGFECEDLYADYNRSPFGTKYPGELIFVARKPRS
jgi:SAM-dependent methyltransferase